MLAPLMDRMTTMDLDRRFTASQALQFLEEFTSNMTEEELLISPPPRSELVLYDEFDRWSGLPERFLMEWAHFREPKPPRSIRLIRCICTSDWGLSLVQLVRKAFRFGETMLRRYNQMTWITG
jgi:hypothetical protein